MGSYADHQFVAGMHTDKAHTHMHVMVNRVHPDRLTAHTPEFYFKAIDKSCRELENKYGWKESPGLYKWDYELKVAVEVSQDELEQRRRNKLETRRGAEGKAAHLEYYGDDESILNKVRRTAAEPLRELFAKHDTRWKDVHGLLAGLGFELHKSECGGYTVEDVSTGTRVKASKAFRAPYHKTRDQPGIPGAFCGKKNRQATEELLGAWEPMSAELRAKITEQSLFRTRDAWARQTGGFHGLSKQDQQAASVAFAEWQQIQGGDTPEETVEEFVVKCQRPAVLRATKEARREEPAAWSNSRRKSPQWTRESGGVDALSPELKKDAERDYSQWTTKNPDAARRYSLADYVDFRQQREAAKFATDKLASEQRNENRERRVKDRRSLGVDFTTYRKQRREELKKHTDQSRARYNELRAAHKKRKQDIRADRAALWAIRRVQLQQADREFAEAKRALQHDLLIERMALKPMSREQWVAMQAEAGDGRAIRQLRGWRYQRERLQKASEKEHPETQLPWLSAGDPSMEAPATWAFISFARLREEDESRKKEISAAFKRLSHRFDRKTGDVYVLIDGREALVDRGALLHVVDGSEAAKVLGLEMAINKFGPRLTATGSDEWKRSIAVTAVHNRINVSFADEWMNTAMREERERIELEHRKAVEGAATDHAREHPPVKHPDVQFIDTVLEQLERGELRVECFSPRQAELLVAAALLDEKKGAVSEQLKRARWFVKEQLSDARTEKVREVPLLHTLKFEVPPRDVQKPVFNCTLPWIAEKVRRGGHIALEERVRAQVGHVVQHFKLAVEARDGHVTVTGEVLPGEKQKIADRLREIRGGEAVTLM
ncbi:MAG TPA: relaxase/mobilization nuclease domain-containing protein [Terriglobales bacterium]|nr:relaxase/mobilization nuclease domain-containing protein [Terriglobales bacterium]